VVDLSHGPVPLLLLLDEIFAGTNSHERRLGAEVVVKGLVAAGAIGLASTRDLTLSRIADEPGRRGASDHLAAPTHRGTRLLLSRHPTTRHRHQGDCNFWGRIPLRDTPLSGAGTRQRRANPTALPGQRQWLSGGQAGVGCRHPTPGRGATDCEAKPSELTSSSVGHVGCRVVTSLDCIPLPADLGRIGAGPGEEQGAEPSGRLAHRRQ